jgi:hypothetical protein
MTIHCAGQWNDGTLEGMKYWLKNGADVHDNDNEALIRASSTGRLEVVKYLVEECGADVHARNNQALRLAISHGHLDVVRHLEELMCTE